MEEILSKNIFIEKDLLKHSPDYSPQDIFLRMQLRRDIARDSHKHGALRYNSKKDVKKTKGCFKLKKEIVKLRAYFDNINLQNQSLIKNAERTNKYKNVLKNKDYNFAPTTDQSELIGVEMALYLNQSSDDKDNLVIENNSDFKLVVKEKGTLRDENSCFKNINYDSNVLMLEKYTNPQTGNDCINKKINSNNILKSPINEPVEIKHKNEISKKLEPPFNEFKNDLQSLLIMMTINSNMDENVESVDALQVENFEEESRRNSRFETDIFHAKIESPRSYQSKDLSKLLNITFIGTELNFREKYLTNKYIKKWNLYVTTKRENRVLKQRQETLNNFFNKLSTKKNNIVRDIESVQKAKKIVRDYNTYHHRYKVQKHIIALQKTKLEEQNKIIEQLKYNKIVEASRESLDTLKEDVRKTYYEIDKHLKPKIKCLTNDLKIKEFEEPSLVLHCLKMPQFLQRMETRAREREEKHAMIRERRKQIEEERIKQKQQAELAKLEMDKEEKMKRIKELKQKRKKEKIENIRKKQHAERLRALIVMGDLHYERNLMNKYGIRPLRRLIEMKYDNMEKAKAHYRFQLLKNIFLHWMWYTEDMWFDRNYKAEDFYRKNILKKSFCAFKENHHEFILKKQVAEDYYELYVSQIVFKKFCKGIEIVKKEFELKLKKAQVYYNSNILFKTFTCWRTLPALNALKREQDARKLRWREKVLLVVPDYKPPED